MPSCIIFKQLKVITHSCYVLIIQMVECRNAVIVCDLGVASPHFKSSSKVFFATDEQQLDYYFPKLCHISCKLGRCHAWNNYCLEIYPCIWLLKKVWKLKWINIGIDYTIRWYIVCHQNFHASKSLNSRLRNWVYPDC